MSRAFTVVLLLAIVSVAQLTPANAACAGYPDDLSFTQMIEQGTTGSSSLPLMILGRVERIRDPGPDGGRAIAVVCVRAHPTGFVPDQVRIRYRRPVPGMEEGWMQIDAGDRWVFLARRAADHTFRSDYYDTIEYCGKSRQVGRGQFRNLLQLARHHD